MIFYIKWLTIIGYLAAITVPLVKRVQVHGFTDRISLALLVALIMPPLLLGIFAIVRKISAKRMEVDVASDHIADVSLFSGMTIKHIMLGVGIVIALMFVILIPTPWNLFVLLAGAYLIFASIRQLG